MTYRHPERSRRATITTIDTMKYIIPLLLLMILASCGKVSDIELTSVSGVEFIGMENSTLSFSADIGVSNPSSMGFTVSEINLKTTIDGNFIGTLTSPERVKIPPRSDSTYTMNFSLELANIITSASALYNLSRKNQVNVVMQGYVKARSGLATKKVDVNETRLMDVPRNFR